MPNFNLSQQPKYPIVKIDTNEAITVEQILSLFDAAAGITLCIRSGSGHPDRGGYYFCIQKNDESSFSLETIEGVYVDKFNSDTLIKFINHASGRQFHADILEYCQNSINFRTD